MKKEKLQRNGKTYWKKHLEENLTTKEKKELEKLENENLKIVEAVYNALIEDKEIQKHIERIKEQEWVQVMER